MSLGNKYSTVDTKDLVATIAYLIGVKKHIVEKCFDAECHELLQTLYSSQLARPYGISVSCGQLCS